MNTNKTGIYCIFNKFTGKYYIGSSKNVYSRMSKHRADLKRKIHCNKYLQYAYNKQGADAFIYFPVEFTTIDSLLDVEQIWLDTINPDRSYNIQFNVYEFPDWTGRTHTPESVEKIKLHQKGKPKLTNEEKRFNKLAAIEKRKGQKRSEEVCKRMSESSGSSFPDLITPNGEVLTNLINLKRFCRDHGLSVGAMEKLILGCSQSHKGYRLATPVLKVNPKFSELWLYHSEHGEVLVINKNQFCKIYDLRYRAISRVIVGDIKSHRGWYLSEKSVIGIPEKVIAVRENYKPIPDIIDPSGKIISNLSNLKQFCEEHDLSYAVMQNVIKGLIWEHKGYSLAEPNMKFVPKFDELWLENKELGLQELVTARVDFCRKYNINTTSLSRLLKGGSNTLKGWTISDKTILSKEQWVRLKKYRTKQFEYLENYI